MSSESRSASAAAIDAPQVVKTDIDFKRLDGPLATRLATEIPYASQRSFGSVALDWCWLAAGRCHIYLHGRSHLWDYAAGELILAEAGGYSCTLDGEPVSLTLTEFRLLRFLVSRPGRVYSRGQLIEEAIGRIRDAGFCAIEVVPVKVEHDPNVGD